MARKNLLLNVTGDKPVGGPLASPIPTAAPAVTPFGTRGAAGSISKSLGDLTARAAAAKDLETKLTAGQVIVELDTGLIDPSFVADRMTADDDQAFQALKQAIASEGQGSPILVRPHPTAEGRYQVAFGHRRLRVAKALGTSVRAVVKSLADQDLVLAQGQENSLRADLSFIERARFAQKLVTMNYPRDVAMAALAVDKTTMSRMLSITARIPSAVIDAIGPTPAAGRDRWLELAARFESEAMPAGLNELLSSGAFHAASSDDRFTQVFDLVINGIRAADGQTGKRKGQGERQDVQGWAPPKGETLVTLKHNARNCVLNIDERKAPEFGEFLLRQMGKLYDDYLTSRQS